MIPNAVPFTRRSLPINWGYYSQVDVPRISTTGDRHSVELLMNNLAYGNITNADAAEFASRGALHAFLLLQLAVEHLAGQNYELRAIQNLPPPPPPPPPPRPTFDPQNLHARMELMKKDIAARDLVIENLTLQIQALEHERDEAFAVNQSLRSRLRRGARSKQESESSSGSWT
jgi:hypothetical protein